MWKINFTGQSEEGKEPCPSERARHHRTIHTWPGNRPTNVEVPIEPMTVFDHLDEND